MPLVSVIVPNYNHGRFLQQRLDSILRQAFQDFELIILDDASTDNSGEIIRRHLGEPRVRFIPSDTNSGSPFVQWNRGVAAACGEYIWIAESDDYADPLLLATLVPLISKDPSIGLVYCQSNHVDENDVNHGSLAHWTDDLALGRWEHKFFNDGRDEVERFFVLKNPILNASAVLFRRATYIAAGGAPTHLRQCGDWLTWVRMLLRSAVCFEPQALNFFRSHSGNVRSATHGVIAYREFIQVQQFILKNVPISSEIKRALCRSTLRRLRELFRTAPPLPISDIGRCLWATVPILARNPGHSVRLVWNATEPPR